MYDEAALRRLVSRLRRDLLELPERIEYFAKAEPPGHDDYDYDYYRAAEYQARTAIENMVLLVSALLLSTPMLIDIYNEFRKSLPNDLLEWRWDMFDGERYLECPARSAVERFSELGIAALGGIISAERLEVLDNICAGLGDAITRFIGHGWMQPPNRETPVRQFGFILLKASFPDTEPDGGIIFRLADGTERRPDGAIPSLRLCIEFKYANNEEELSQRVDEIVADMSAYGDPRYDKFRAVFFVPTSYDGVTQDHLRTLVRERLRNVRPQYEWEVFLVKAAGGRQRRSRRKNAVQ
jgi:hypothetical protein